MLLLSFLWESIDGIFSLKYVPNTYLNAIFSYDADIYVANILININKLHITCLDSGVNNIIHYSVYKTC